MPACEEFRTTLEVLLIKQRCSENTSFRWVPTTLMLADCLTKGMDSTFLRAVLARGRFKLHDESHTLEKTAHRKVVLQWLYGQPNADPPTVPQVRSRGETASKRVTFHSRPEAP